MKQTVFNSCPGLQSVAGGTPRASQNLGKVEMETNRNDKSSLNVITFCPACCWQQVLVDQHTEGRSSSQLLCKQRQQQALLAQRAGMWPGTLS